MEVRVRMEEVAFQYSAGPVDKMDSQHVDIAPVAFGPVENTNSMHPSEHYLHAQLSHELELLEVSTREARQPVETSPHRK